MKKYLNLLEGPILPSLGFLALPIMATSLIQMAYNLTDMIWIGRLGSDAVASVGAAGMYMWLSNGLATLAKMGGQIKVAHSLGSGENKKASNYAQSALQLGIFFAIIFSVLSILFSTPMIDFFKLNSPKVINDAKIYLIITCGLSIFSFMNQIFTGIFTSMGNSKIAFISTSVGLFLNIILDPLLIFGFGFFPAMGVAGAGIATVIAQAVVMILFVYAAKKDTLIFSNINILSKPYMKETKTIFKIGLPAAVQSMIFSCISMVVARIIAGWGDAAVAVQKVGAQIESISWMTAEGYAAALNSFVAQNYGANNPNRIKKGFKLSILVMLIWGTITTIILVFFPDVVFKIFITEKDVIPLGVDYLTILGVSQIFMCIEYTSSGAFNGLGKTLGPAIVCIIFTAIRIPTAIIFSNIWGLNGVWIAITVSSIIRGSLIFAWFSYKIKNPKFLIKQ